MSISPQSLARTRDKRHSRTPARFDDFVPPEATYRNVAEALRSKGHKNAKRDYDASNKEPLEATPADIEFKDDNLQSEQTSSSNTPEYFKVTVNKNRPPKTKLNPKSEEVSNATWQPETLLHFLTKGKDNDDGNKEAVENLNIEANGPPKLPLNPSTSDHSSEAKKSDDSVTKKYSPFHPSITISNGVSLKGPNTAKPLNEKKPSAPVNNITPTNVSKSSSSKKKTKGLSLMIRTSPNGPYHDVNNPQVVQRQLPQQMRYSNLNQNMQYGSRLMLNEPIHLPKSVSTIAPITATLQQIANQARKPPFISKKAEAYIAYQEARKLDYLMSAHKALVRITQHLDYPDLLNLKRVNKTWRSVVLSDSVWKSVSVKSSTLQKDFTSEDFKILTKNLVKHRTKELVLESICPRDDDSLDCISALCTKDLSLKRLIIKSENQLENRFALELLCGLNKASVLKMCILWKVKVVVSDSGLALVPIECRTKDSCSNEMVGKLYCYSAIKRLRSNSGDTILLEQSELEDLFNAGNKDKSDTHPLDPTKPIVQIKPI